MVDLLMTGGLFVLGISLLIAIVLMLANLGYYFTKVPQGATVFINAGDSMKAVWPNVGGYGMSSCDDLDGRRWLIPQKYIANGDSGDMFYNSLWGTEALQRWLWKQFGVKFISWFWPHIHVHKFDIRKGGRRRIKARTEFEGSKDDAPLKSRIVDSEEKSEVDSLLFLSPRPVYVEGVELAGDSSRVNLLLIPVFRQVIPVLPVYYLKGDFYTLLDAAIEAAMVDFFAKHRVAVKKVGEEFEFAGDSADAKNSSLGESPLTYGYWIKMNKGEHSPLENSLRHLNVTPEYLVKMEEAKGKEELVRYIKEELMPPEESVAAPLNNGSDSIPKKVSGMIPNGIVPRFGLALVSFRIVEWEAHSTTKAFADAFLASEKEKQLARGSREKAYGERDALIALGKGQAAMGEEFLKMLTQKGVAPNVAAQVLATKLRTENIGGSRITTYVEGGGTRTSVMVPAGADSAPSQGRNTEKPKKE